MTERMISFSDKRKQQMTDYSKNHYGDNSWEMTDPKTVVWHYTAGGSFVGAWNTFDDETRKVKGEYPNTTAHYIIDRDGIIYQIIPENYRGRHTIGLNHTSFGIELVGENSGVIEKRINDNTLQIQSAIKLTKYLQSKYSIATENVIGHAEANGSSLFRDISGKKNDHTDMAPSLMNKIRNQLK